MLPLTPREAKNAVTCFWIKLHFSLRKSATNFLCEKPLRDNAFIGLSNRVQIAAGGRPLLNLKFLDHEVTTAFNKKLIRRHIGRFRDTYLGRQVLSRAESGDGVSWGSGGALWAPLAGSGAEPHPKSNLVAF